MSNGKKITIFLADGLPKGIRHVKIDQWSGKAACGKPDAVHGETLAEFGTFPKVPGLRLSSVCSLQSLVFSLSLGN